MSVGFPTVTRQKNSVPGLWRGRDLKSSGFLRFAIATRRSTAVPPCQGLSADEITPVSHFWRAIARRARPDPAPGARFLTGEIFAAPGEFRGT
jgi:hypothetical protein